MRDSAGSNRHLPSDLNSIELHAHTENGGFLIILGIRTGTEHGAKVEVLDLVPLHHPGAPLLLAGLALHLVLDEGPGGIEIGECFHERVVDIIVLLGQAKLRALDLLQNSPVCHEMFNRCNVTGYQYYDLARRCEWDVNRRVTDL